MLVLLCSCSKSFSKEEEKTAQCKLKGQGRVGLALLAPRVTGQVFLQLDPQLLSAIAWSSKDAQWASNWGR